MNIMLELTDTETRRLEALASARGENLSRVAHDLFAFNLINATEPIEDETIALLAQWAEEDDTDDIEELERRDSETSDFMASVEAERVTFPVISK